MSHLNHSNPDQQKADTEDEWLDAVNALSSDVYNTLINVAFFCTATFISNHPLPLGIKPLTPATFFQVSRVSQ